MMLKFRELMICAAMVAALLMPLQGGAQEDLVYQKPPKEILELADYERAPVVSYDSKYTWMVLQYRSAYRTIAQLSEKELRLAGLRINPVTGISTGVVYYNNLKYKLFKEAEPKQIAGLPDNMQITNLTWSPDETKIAFTNTTEKGVELWYADLPTGKATRLTDKPILNAVLGSPFTWFRDSKSLLVRMFPAVRPELTDQSSAVPTGPTVSVSEQGRKAQNVTYQDLLKNAIDEKNFEILCTSELYRISLDGAAKQWKGKDLYSGESFSPDGNYLLISVVHRPFSYIVPLQRFPCTTTVYDADGKQVSVIDERPLLEVLPKGFMATYTGKRNISWRSDKPATLYWVEALDGGDPANKADYRDEVFELSAPFSGKPVSLVKTVNRFYGLTWGNETVAVLYDNKPDTRNRKTYLFNPSDAAQQPVIISDRNYQDAYSDPGQFQTRRNEYGRYVLDIEKNKVCLVGAGFSEKGHFPFVDELDLKTLQKRRVYESKYTDKMLEIMGIMNGKTGEYLVRLQSPTEYPNYYIMNARKKIAPQAVTFFENPFKSLANVHKEVIKYKRADGLDLSATLYLPAGYDMQKKEKLPMVMWAYPTEFKDKNSAGQTTVNPNEFIFPSYSTPIYWVTRGYAILDHASFPILGEGDAKPNDTYIEQLVANAKAAIDAADALGYIDRRRVAVGGHSYGGFMTANLLTHSDLFAAGLARSGAYNRTLTPFGFQNEERSYWEAPEVYNAMSPFMHADKMKTPILLIHGVDDNNTGTYTIQSERYFNALKGFGAPARLVLLPKEMHSYAARESVLHVLWEQDQWLEKYVKNRK